MKAPKPKRHLDPKWCHLAIRRPRWMAIAGPRDGIADGIAMLGIATDPILMDLVGIALDLVGIAMEVGIAVDGRNRMSMGPMAAATTIIAVRRSSGRALATSGVRAMATAEVKRTQTLPGIVGSARRKRKGGRPSIGD